MSLCQPAQTKETTLSLTLSRMENIIALQATLSAVCDLLSWAELGWAGEETQTARSRTTTGFTLYESHTGQFHKENKLHVNRTWMDDAEEQSEVQRSTRQAGWRRLISIIMKYVTQSNTDVLGPGLLQYNLKPAKSALPLSLSESTEKIF